MDNNTLNPLPADVKKLYTKSNDKTRNARIGPWIADGQFDVFLTFCADNKHSVRAHPNPILRAFQIRFAGHWMSFIWNKKYKRFTADHRLDHIVAHFKTTQLKK
jgi:hypothetical protein